AAQLALTYLAPQAGELILDCCAAPGGKTAHILERTPESQVVAIDCDETRLKRVRENLQRLELTAQVICGDARYPQ
ncbi:methyltransferase domain-containing protein, partial [Klebsiella pneumoniae]